MVQLGGTLEENANISL